MKHRATSKRKFGRTRSQHKAIMKNLFRTLVMKKEIKTTEPKAKELKTYSEKLISKCKDPDYLKNKAILRWTSVDMIPRLQKLSKRYGKKTGGYLRIVKIHEPRRDNAKMAKVKLI